VTTLSSRFSIQTIENRALFLSMEGAIFLLVVEKVLINCIKTLDRRRVKPSIEIILT
jgi:hypothetical protein